MVAIPPWLTEGSDAEQPSSGFRDSLPSTDGQRLPTNDSPDIPIFCEGGCGEVLGYMTREQMKSQVGGRWCPACKDANDRAAKGRASLAGRNAGKPAEPPRLSRNLRWLRLLQAIIVAVIIAGSVLIAMGRVTGVYLAALGTMAWCAAYFLVRKLEG